MHAAASLPRYQNYHIALTLRGKRKDVPILQQSAGTWNGVGDLFDVSADLLVDVVEFRQPAVDAASSVFQTRLDVPDFGMHRPVDVLDLPVFDLPNLRLKLLRHLDGT